MFGAVLRANRLSRTGFHARVVLPGARDYNLAFFFAFGEAAMDIAKRL